MKLLAIVSGRLGGNTQTASELIAEAVTALARSFGKECVFEVINLGSENLSFCRGCRLCFERGEQSCPLNDSLLSLRDRIAAADAVILASPVYVEDVSGVMKNFIDRMAFNCYRPAFAGKLALVLTTSGVGATSHARSTMMTALRLWGFSLCGGYNLRMGARLKRDEIRARHGNALQKSAKQLFNAFRHQSALRPSLQSLIVFTVQQHSWSRQNTPSPYTRAYWEEQGWLNPKCAFYIPHKRKLAQGFARIAGHAIARFFV